ncbi:hypothetical protein DFP72DRAFT_1074880 [Ephemerocybe angulata]|uniref:Uncharacterized protein n=1 Tax=Ephemerocybe angulata TaxID=980116 RepID=A0A8H6HIR2_9AGAR|nr:hypothetical protein DFP72DRAFT_1074880 [Tulosesus angulatus]
MPLNELDVPHDAIAHIATFLPLERLFEAAALPNAHPMIAQIELRRRIQVALEPYISMSTFIEFMDILRSCGGAITGSVVRELMLQNTPVRPLRKPANLNIVTNFCMEGTLRSLLRSEGYTSTVLDHQQNNGHVDLVERFVKRCDGTTRCIILSVSKSNAIAAVLSTPFTAQMCVITHNSLISLHPKSTFANESFVVEGSERKATLADLTFEVVPDNAHWTEPCGTQCPMRWRKTPDDTGAAIYSWAVEEGRFTSWGMAADDGQAFLYEEPLVWRVGHRCFNRACPNMQLYHERLAYLFP